jgi:RNA polymerase sigma-70 factor (ECF subfamily)
MMDMSFTAVADDRLIFSSRAGLVRSASRLVGPADAEDVVQDAFERALRARTVRAETDPRPWLNRITRNVAYDALKSRSRTTVAAPAIPDAESAEHAVVRHETAAELDVALQQLSPALRRTIVLHDLQGYSNHEIASLDGVSYHTVRTRLFRARRSMRDALAPVAA